MLGSRRSGQTPSRWFGLVLILALYPVLFGFPPAQTADQAHGDLRITNAWSRATPEGAPVGAGYLTITNAGTQSDRLVSGETAIPSKVEFHEMSMTDGIMRMRPLASGIDIPAGGSVELKPGGLHIMFIGLKNPIELGKPFSVALTFARSGKVEVAFGVEKAGARAPNHAGTPAHQQPHSH